MLTVAAVSFTAVRDLSAALTRGGEGCSSVAIVEISMVANHGSKPMAVHTEVEVVVFGLKC